MPLQHEIHKQQPFESPEQEASLNILRTHSVLSAAYQRLFRPYGLSTPTYNTLRILRGAGQNGSTCTQIRDHMVAQVPDVTRIVDRLVAEGLARRTRSGRDRRVVRVTITDKGLDLLARLDAPVIELHRAQLGHMSRNELVFLSRLLEKARQANAG